MSEEENHASQKMALAIIDQLQETGERDKLKEWFAQQLKSTNWPREMLCQATKIAENRMSQEKKEQKHDDNSPNNKISTSNVLTANQLTKELMDYGIESFPQEVFAKLYNQLLPVTRSYISSQVDMDIDMKQPSNMAEEPS